MAQTKQTSKNTKAPKKTIAKKPALKAMSVKQKNNGISGEEQYRMIAERAYDIAEARGFDGNTELDDWLQAEAEIRDMG